MLYLNQSSLSLILPRLAVHLIKVIELLEQSEKTLRQVARELGVAENNLYYMAKRKS